MADLLADTRVLDLTNASGALAGRILADLGADVVMVEPPEGGESRRLAPFVDDEPGPERSYRHLYFNANKRSIVLDLQDEAGREQLKQLAATSDVLLETGAPGAMAAAGLGYEELRAINPSLINVSITPFGQDAEWADWKANDLVASAAAGLLQVSGEREDPPTHGPAFPAYTMSGLAAATGALIALWGRDRTPGRPGAQLDISMQEATSFALVQTANPCAWTWLQEIPVRPALSQTVECGDGKWVGFNVRAQGMAEFIELLNDAGIDHDYTPDDWELVHQGGMSWNHLNNPLQWKGAELAARLPRDELLEKMWAMRSAAMPTLDFPQMLETEHFQVSGQFFEVEDELIDRPLEFSRSPMEGALPGRPIRRAPSLGEDTENVLAGERSLPASDAAAEMPFRPLEGVKIVDFTWVAAGPLTTRILSNFGAEVWKVESGVRPDPLRVTWLPGDRRHSDIGDLLNESNTGKRSVTLDLTKESARNLVRELVAKADVVMNNYTAGKLAEMGFPYEELRKINPKIVLLHLPGVGGDTPWVKHRTLGNLLMAASGQNYLMGFPDRPPRGMGIAYPDFTSPHLAATSILAALREVQRTGEGREITLGQLSATVSLFGAEWMRFRHTKQQPPRPGNRDPNYCPHGVYRCRGEDQWVALAISSDDEWQMLAGLMADSAPEAATFATLEGRRADEDALDAAIESWTQDQDKWELAATLQAHGIAAAPVENLPDMMKRDPQMVAHYQMVHQPSEPDFDISIDADAMHFVGQPERVLERAPMLGEHNEYVLREVLGLSEKEFDELVVEGVIA